MWKKNPNTANAEVNVSLNQQFVVLVAAADIKLDFPSFSWVERVKVKVRGLLLPVEMGSWNVQSCDGFINDFICIRT